MSRSGELEGVLLGVGPFHIHRYVLDQPDRFEGAAGPIETGTCEYAAYDGLQRVYGRSGADRLAAVGR